MAGFGLRRCVCERERREKRIGHDSRVIDLGFFFSEFCSVPTSHFAFPSSNSTIMKATVFFPLQFSRLFLICTSICFFQYYNKTTIICNHWFNIFELCVYLKSYLRFWTSFLNFFDKFFEFFF